MRDSADSDHYRVTRRGRKRGKFDDDEAVFAKRGRHLPRPRAEDANDATDGLPEGDRWSTWDQAQSLIPSEPSRSQSLNLGVALGCLSTARPAARAVSPARPAVRRGHRRTRSCRVTACTSSGFVSSNSPRAASMACRAGQAEHSVQAGHVEGRRL